jgi:hypothetical protein
MQTHIKDQTLNQLLFVKKKKKVLAVVKIKQRQAERANWHVIIQSY